MIGQLRSRLGLVGGFFLVVAAMPLVGCARGPDVESALSLQRVVIYRNGVGYYERRGHVDDPEVTFKVRTERIGDFLATLAVMEQGGSSVRSASFPVDIDKKKGEEDEEEETDDEAQPDVGYGFPMPPKPPKKKKKKKDDRETVRLTLDGNDHDLVIGYVAETPVWRPSYRLVIGKPGASGTEATADLQAWGIVQNQSGEDWKGVKLTLVAGAPLAFQATLDKPVIPQRPIVTDQGEVIGSLPQTETTLSSMASAPPPPPPPPPMAYGGEDEGGPTLDGLLAESDMAADEPMAEMAAGAMKRPMSQPMKKSADRSRRTAGVYGTGGMPSGAAPSPVYRPEPGVIPSGPRNVNALAAVAVEGGTTRYDLPFPVDIPNKSATMVLLLAQRVPGEANFLFAPDGGVGASFSHPFRVARFTNNTKGMLEKGPIAVFDDGAFLGQGMVDPLPPGAIATVPFALERGIAVSTDRTQDELSARLAKVEGGQIYIERDYVYHTKYTISNGTDFDARTLVKHPRNPGTRLENPPKGTEDNIGTGSALVPFVTPKRGTNTLDVEERRSFSRQVDVLSVLADDAVKAYMTDPRADKLIVADLKKAWDARGRLRSAIDERNKLSVEQANLERESEQLRRNLKAIEKVKDDPRDTVSRQNTEKMRQDFTDRLGKASIRLGDITKRMTIIEIEVSEQSIRLRDIISGIKLDKPLPTP